MQNAHLQFALFIRVVLCHHALLLSAALLLTPVLSRLRPLDVRRLGVALRQTLAVLLGLGLGLVRENTQFGLT